MAGRLPVQRLTEDALRARVTGQARCADSGLDPDQWYPVSTEPARARREAAAAIAVCAGCPVRPSAWSCRCGTGTSASTVSGAAWSPPTARSCAAGRPAGHRGRRRTAGSAMIVRPPFPPGPLGLVQGGDAR